MASPLGPQILETWEMDLNITHLKYKPTVKRLATPDDLQQHHKRVCEHCHGPTPSHTCQTCHRGFHPTCQPQDPTTGLCSQCQDSQHWSASKQHTYQEAIRQWYIEWEPQWEDEKQVRMLGYGAVVDQTLTHIQNNPPPPTKPSRDTHLSNKEKQGNSRDPPTLAH
jgi:hypothetical protein